MVSTTSAGDYKIVNGTTDEIVAEMNNDDVVRQNVLGFQFNSSTDVTVMYYISP